MFIKVRKIVKGTVFIILAAAMLTGCQSQKTVVTETDEEIKIPIILTVNPSTGNRNEQELVNAFNREYEGVYRMDVEWIMETEEEYRKNLKRLNVTDELPAVITDLRMLPSYYEILIADNRIEDLSSYINNDEEWKRMIEPKVFESFVEEDGSIYLAPLSTGAFSCSGIYWNEELFDRAGIEEFPATWEEFWKCCDQLSSHGITPLALHTEGTGWSAMLLATAEMADTKEGAEFMEQLYPRSYDNESIYHMAETLQKMFRYTTKDALYSDFDAAYNNFMTGNAAMLPNGYWMIGQIEEDFAKQVRFSPFPGNKLVSSPETFGWAVVSSYEEEVRRGAVEFLKFRTRWNGEQKEMLFSGGGENSRLLDDYLRSYENDPQIVPSYQVKWNSVLQEKTLGEALQLFAQNKITSEAFVTMLNNSVEEFIKEK